MTSCRLCGSQESVTHAIGLCRTCLLAAGAVPARATAIRQASRARFGLPETVPRATSGVRCTQCVNECAIPEGSRGFCGLREVKNGRLMNLAGTPSRGLAHWHRDSLPTNCVASWVCEGSHQQGRNSLAVYYASCTMDCIFCQNWQFRGASPRNGTLSAGDVADATTPETFCACFFGGDPASQMGHALALAEGLVRRGVRVCWETNATMNRRQLDRTVGLSLPSGGCIKIDLKALDDTLHTALTGVSNARTLENFRRVGERVAQRPDPPLLIASTLLVPGYVTPEEVGAIARFIASVDARIPYTLLAFAPQYLTSDLPPTSRAHAHAAEAEARAAGLQRVHIGNEHLLIDEK